MNEFKSHAIDDSEEEESEDDNMELKADVNDETLYQKMCEKVEKLRMAANKAVCQENAKNTLELSDEIDKVRSTCIDFYGQRQLNVMMKSIFFESLLVQSNFSIPKVIGIGKATNAEEEKFEE